MRKYRLSEIKRILGQETISSQEILQSKLETAGFKVTQATLSRDLAFLKVGKVFDVERGYIYVLPQDLKKLEEHFYPYKNSLNGFLGIKFSNNIAVMSTLPGYASQLGVLIDNLKMEKIIGTVAGDDTIILVIDENTTREDFVKHLTEHLPEISDKLGNLVF